MLAKKCLLVGIFTLLSLSLAIAAPPAVHPTTGEPLVIDCLRGTPDAIDGDLSDWNLEAMTPAVLDSADQLYSGQAVWTGPEDSSGEFYLLWDDQNIYIAVVMKDDKLSMNKSGGDIWNADCIEIFFSTTDAVAAHTSTTHYQYGFNANNQRWNWCNMDGSGAREPDYLQIASSKTADGYICEASIEYGQMLSLDFAVGNAIGFHPVFDDADNGDRKLQMTWTSREAHDQSQGFGHMFLSSDPAIVPELSNNPSPADEATDVPRDVVLSWTPGIYAPAVNGHKVYLSENFNDVNEGIGGINQDANSYTPAQRLDFSKTYYWRVDEVNGPPDFTVYPGEVWQFTAEPIAFPIAGTSITATASSQFNPNTGPEKTINGSGLDENDLHSTKETDMWGSNVAGPQPTWIQYEFDRVYKLHQMWVWNHNTAIEPFVGFGIKDATIEYSLDGANWATLGTTHEFAQAPGQNGYAHNTTVDFGGTLAKYVKLTANSNWGGLLPQYGLSEVRFFHIPVFAREPAPASGATDVPIGTIDEPIDVTLSLRAGREAAKHDVYLSTDQQAVIDETISPVSFPADSSYANYGPLSLDLGKSYYWKVNEVNEAETPTTWQGELWDFTTQEYFVVDDIEDYNDFEPDRIFDTWIDGWGVATNGSQVGYAEPPFVETTIVHGGSQSMPFSYDNTGGVAYSETERAFATPQDWTVRGIKALTLWFRGNPAAFQESPPGTFTISADGADIWNSADEFRYVYKQLSGNGEIVAQVLSVEKTDPWAKAGVMIRDTLDAGSRNAFTAITGGDGDGATFQWRPNAGGSSSSSRTLVGISPPASVKLVRQGNIFTGYVFLDGQWQQEGESATVAMQDPVYIGLAVTSHSAGVICEAKFSDVSTTGAVTGPWQVAEIGAAAHPANTAAPLYVAVADSAGKSAEVKHPDPAATTIGTWTEWNIDLADFIGVNPRSINKMIIGVGDKVNPQPAAGLVYFDDIRLYPLREP